MSENCDVAVVGAGAAGLMAAIFAARGGARVVALDGAKKLGAKIIMSGGGRCNVTHDVVHASDFNGSRNAIAKILRTFDVPATIAFFADLGVTLKREETGKLFPTTDKARTVLDALLRAANGVQIRTGCKVSRVERGFAINDDLHARKVILATGGRSVAKTGSDGSGYSLVKALGHTVTPLFPGLVPLVLPDGHPLTTLSGLSVEAELAVRSPTGKVLHRERGSMLFTHFGLSGPVVLDISRHWIANQPSTLTANLLPGESFESLDAKLIDSPRSIRQQLPARLWDLLGPKDATREERRRLTRDLLELPLPVIRDRGFDYAEVTAGGVPLSEIDTATMESRICPGLYLCGEILDVDGRIGGYNFQWAWATGRLAGISV